MTFSRLIVAVAILARAAPVMAQPAPSPGDLFAGYSLLPANGDDFPRQRSHGVQGAVAFHLNRWFGIVGDIGAQYSTARDLGPGFEGLVARTRVVEYFVGPRFTARLDGVDVFAHGIIGRAHGDAGEDFRGFSDSAVAFGGGGGVDVRVRPRLAIRTQFDLFGSFADIVDVNPRFAVGLVVGLGGG